ncbi:MULTISPECIES: hypothetical protein [Levilactobacillus]|uniref:hypothetical protein n=1 Tax=Levilactobacillus TaxID=2767886 RepID=UPI00375803EB
MQSSLKKSLYLGLAALSFVSVAAVSTTASAKSYAKAGAYTVLKADATKRNVEATGTNALYTKPGTVKGAKVVASKATMAKLAASKKSADYFRAYGQKTTNRGSVYYRVVTMDGKYRGYVYGGKTADTFAGGVKSAETTVDKTATDTTVGKTVYFANPGKTNVTWTAPKYTQYKASKNVTNTQPFAADALKVTKAATKTREGSLYYYVEDAANPSVSGWIYSKAVTTDSSVAFNQTTDVKVNFVDGSTVVKSGVLQDVLSDDTNAVAKATGTAVGKDATVKATTKDTTTNTTWVDNELKGTGYTYVTSSANAAALLAAKTGDTITLNVKKGDTVTTTISAYENSTATDGTTVTNTKLTNVDATKYNAAVETAKTDQSALNYTDFGKQVAVFPSLTTGFTGVSGASFTSTDLSTFANSNKLGTLYSPTFYVAKSGATDAVASNGTNGVPAYVEYDLKSANAGTYGDKAQLFYNSKFVYGSESPAKVSSSNQGNDIFDNATTAPDPQVVADAGATK